MGVPGDIETGVDSEDDPASWTEKYNIAGPEWKAPGKGETLTRMARQSIGAPPHPHQPSIVPARRIRRRPAPKSGLNPDLGLYSLLCRRARKGWTHTRRARLRSPAAPAPTT